MKLLRMTSVSYDNCVMPKQTFHNLPKEKQETILDAALKEFSEYGYDLASIQRMVENSGIPRGSFYQYFEDKTDIYGAIMQEIGVRKMKYLEPFLEHKEELGLFELIEKLTRAAMRFGHEDPQAYRIGKDLFNSKTLNLQSFLAEIKKEAYQRNQMSPESLYSSAIQNSLKRGEINPSYSPEFIIPYLEAMIDHMGQLLVPINLQDPTGQQGKKKLDEFIELLRYGLSAKHKTGPEGLTNK